MFLILVIPAALTYTFGRMVGDTRQGWAIFAAFSVMFLIGVFVCYGFEQAGNPILAKLGLQTAATAGQAGGNMEGKEVRFGIVELHAVGDHHDGHQLRRRQFACTTASRRSPDWCRCST